MIQKIELLMRSGIPEREIRTHTMDKPPNDHFISYEAEPAVSIIDVVNKLNEVIDYLNAKESNATK